MGWAKDVDSIVDVEPRLTTGLDIRCQARASRIPTTPGDPRHPTTPQEAPVARSVASGEEPGDWLMKGEVVGIAREEEEE
jgi:hypothetical protein